MRSIFKKGDREKCQNHQRIQEDSQGILITKKRVSLQANLA